MSLLIPPTRRLLLSSMKHPPPPSFLPDTDTHTHNTKTRRITTPMATSPTTTTPSEKQQLINQAIKYHNQTKHSLTHYARGPHGLDWANQPNPFRRFISSPLLPLLHLPPQKTPHTPLYSSLFCTTLPSPQPLSLSTLSQLLYDSLSLSAWKTTGFSTWSLRVNPSSGNLHPTESYIISPPISSLSDSPFVAHYAPKDHALELRTLLPPHFFPRFFPPGCFLVGLSSIFWREAWKYGERAFRYCNHDVGHAIAAVSFAAAALGWDVKLLDGLGVSDLQNLMGVGELDQFPELEFEHPDCILLVFPSTSSDFSINYAELSAAIGGFSSSLEWKGTPNSLSKDHVRWDIIYETAEAVAKPLTVELGFSVDPFQSSTLLSEGSYKGLTIREVVRKRRSAVEMDGVHVMERETFYQILLHCLPSGYKPQVEKQGGQLAFPYRVLPWDSEIHATLFVHRVSGLPKGLYFLVRNEEHFDTLKQATRSEFEWEKPGDCPVGLPLYRLARGDCRVLAKKLSCHQDIAGDGCFSVGMVARFKKTLSEKNVWMYPRLFWESGVLGQVLYLEAHAIGISATGIGCYFDDAVHEFLGLSGSEFQSLYHFTVGSPLLDRRIMSLPAYPGPTVDA